MAWPTLTDALVITEVRTLLGEPTPRRISDAEITRWIDKGMQIIGKRNLVQQQTQPQILVANQYNYSPTALPAGTSIIGMRAVIYRARSTSDNLINTGAKALLRMTPRHFSNIRVSTAGPPQEYLWFENVLYIWPLPDSTNFLQLFWWAIDTDLSAGDEFASFLPTQYQPLLIWYAYSQALFKVGQPAQAAQYLSFFNNMLLYGKQNDEISNITSDADSKEMMNLLDNTKFIGG